MNAPQPKCFVFELFVIFTALTFSIPRAEAVTDFAASDGTYNDKISITWNGGTAINTDTKVWRAMSPSGIKSFLGYAVVEKAGNGYYPDSEVAPEKTYYYWVEECDAFAPLICDPLEGGDSGYRRLDVPTGVSATQGAHTDKVVISWSAVTGADPFVLDYQVHRSASDDGAKTHIGTIQTTSFTDLTVPTPGTGYFYFVTACISGGGGCGEASGSALGWQGLAAPVSVSASDGTSTTAITISWSAVAGAAGYQIYRRTNSIPNLFTTTYSPTPTTYDDTSVGAGFDIYYMVRAFSYPNPDYPNAAFLGPLSAEDAGWKAYTAPTQVEATYKTDVDKVVVSWGAVSNAHLYEIYRSESADGAQTKIGSRSFIESREFNDTAATPGVPYHYRVAACLSADNRCGEKGGPAVGIRKLSAPSTFTASDGLSDLHVALSWAAVSGAHAYNIYRKEGDGDFAYLDYTPFTSFKDATAFPGRMYSYYVQAYVSGYVEHDSSGDAGPIDTGWRTASAPLDIDASDGVYTNKVRINWTPATGDNVTYRVRRKIEDVIGSSTELANSLAGPPYDDTSAEPEVEYEYSVFSCTSLDDQNACLSLSDTGWAALACNVNMVSSHIEGSSASHEACEVLVLGPDFIATDGAAVSANSGWEIHFMPEFLVEHGATFSANVCGQSLCELSDSPMPQACHSCVNSICAQNSACCETAFDQTCLDMVYSVCNLVCETD